MVLGRTVGWAKGEVLMEKGEHTAEHCHFVWRLKNRGWFGWEEMPVRGAAQGTKLMILLIWFVILMLFLFL